MFQNSFHVSTHDSLGAAAGVKEPEFSHRVMILHRKVQRLLDVNVRSCHVYSAHSCLTCRLGLGTAFVMAMALLASRIRHIGYPASETWNASCRSALDSGPHCYPLPRSCQSLLLPRFLLQLCCLSTRIGVHLAAASQIQGSGLSDDSCTWQNGWPACCCPGVPPAAICYHRSADSTTAVTWHNTHDCC